MPLILRPPGTRPLTERLADLGRARKLAAVLAAGMGLLAMAVALVIVSGLLDAAFHLPAFLRAIELVALLSVVGIGWWRLMRPALRESAHPLAVALRLERLFPRLNDALASAIEFQATAGSEQMTRFQRVATLRAENLAERLDFRRTVPSRRAWIRFWLLALACGVAAALALVSPTRATAALYRLFDPFGRHPWPTRTLVSLTDAPTLLALGESYPLRFRVHGVLPEQATISVLPHDGVAVEEVVAVPTDGDVTRVVDPGRVSRDFEIRVIAGDGTSDTVRVEVSPPPRLVPIDGRPTPLVRLEYPAYTDLPPLELPDGAGVIEGVCGTRVSFRAAADRTIRSAALAPQFDLTPYHAAATVATLACDNPLSVVLAREVAREFTSDITVRCSGTELSAEFTPPLAGLYTLRFTDSRGLTGTRLIDFRLYPDHSPAVTLDRPAIDRDTFDLLPSAHFTLAATAEDRPFAVRWLALEYRVGPDGRFRQLKLADAEAASDLPTAFGGGMAALQQLKPPAASVVRDLAVASLTRRDGRVPVDGDVITLRAAAADWDTRTALKEPGRSAEIELRIASRDSLEAKLQRDLAGFRPDLLRMREELRTAKEKLTAPNYVAEADAAIRGVKAKVDDPAVGLKAQADRLQQTMQANALSRSPTTDKVEATADAARRTNELLEQAASKTGEARATNAKQAADEARTAVTAAEDEVNKLLERLEQWGSAGEVRGEARALKDQVARAGVQADAARDQMDRNRVADQLDKAADQAAGLIGKTGRMAVEKDAQAAADRATAESAEIDRKDELRKKAENTAAEAEALRNAVRSAGGEAVPEDLRQAASELRRNRLGESAEARKSAEERLSKMADPLAETRSPSKSRSADTANKLAATQDELRKKTKQAAGTPNPEQQVAELQKLAREQQKLKEEAEKLAERLTREKNEPAAVKARQAASALGTAAEQMQQGKNPEQQQADAQKQLEDVKQQLDPDQKKPTEQLSREQRAELADKLKALRDRQNAAVEEATRVVAAAASAGQWDRPLIASLGDLDERETALANDVRPIAEKELEGLPVFAKLAAQAVDAMSLAGKRAAARRDDVALADTLDPVADERVVAPMRLALRKLDQIIAAIAPGPADAKPRADTQAGGEAGQGGAQPGGGGGQPGGRGNGVPPLAQLKALRAMQAEVAEQTAAFAQSHPDPSKLKPDEQAELAALEQSQRDVAELFAKLAAAFRPPEEELP